MKECSRSISIQNCGSDVRFERRHVFGRIDLYSVHWVHEANRNLASSRCYSDVAIVHHSRFCKANRNMVPGSPARTKIRDVTQWSLYKSILPKNMAVSKSDVTSAVLNWYWPRTFLHTFATKLSIRTTGRQLITSLVINSVWYISVPYPSLSHTPRLCAVKLQWWSRTALSLCADP